MAPTRKQIEIIEAAARKYHIDPSIEYGVWGTESGFGTNRSTSPTGAQGDFQFEPGTAKSLGINPNNFESAALGAARYLSQYRSRGVKGMLGAYNAGPAGTLTNPETAAYIPKVLRYAKEFKGLGRIEKSQGNTIPTSSASENPVAQIQRKPDRSNVYEALSALSESEVQNPYTPKGQNNYKFLQSLTERQVAQEGTTEQILRAAHRSLETQPNVPNQSETSPKGGTGPSKAIQWASKRVGVAETGTNVGPRISAWEHNFGMNAQPWCGIFVGNALQQAGVRGIDSRVASTAAIVEMARKHEGGFSGLSNSPSSGEVVVWDPGPNGHTGLVVGVDKKNGTITTIEGNASNQVMKRTHPIRGAYYVRPAY